MSENAEDANSESQLQINAVESSEQSTHRDSELWVCIYIYVYVCVCACVYVRAYVHVRVCVCVCVCFESMHIGSNRALIIYRGFDTLLFYIILIAFKAV